MTKAELGERLRLSPSPADSPVAVFVDGVRRDDLDVALEYADDKGWRTTIVVL